MDTDREDFVRLLEAVIGLRNHLSVFCMEALSEIERLQRQVNTLIVARERKHP